MMQKKGITLIALVITIIVLLILAGVAVGAALNGESIFSKANEAKTSWNSKIEQEDYEVGRIFEYSESGTLADPAEEYGYDETTYELVNAKDLREGDIINYYYDTSKPPIPCAVLFNDSTHGIEAVTLDCVKNDIAIGYDDGPQSDPKADEAFANGMPSGYEGLAIYTEDQQMCLEKCRWSYNHAFQTLKSYAMEYKGDMAKNVRCIGAPDSILNEENQLSNMHKINESYTHLLPWDNLLKDSDSWNTCDELTKMETLGILGTPSQTPYWVASRIVGETTRGDGTYLVMYGMKFRGTTGNEGSYRIFAIGYKPGDAKCVLSVVISNTFRITPSNYTKRIHKGGKNWPSVKRLKRLGRFLSLQNNAIKIFKTLVFCK